MNNRSQVIGTIIHETVTESDSNIVNITNQKAYATGVIQDLGRRNRNGRTYLEADMRPEVEGDRIQKELIPTGNMRGHAGHPSSTELSIQSVIDPVKCCVQFDKIWIDKNLIRANFHGTNNELGKAFNMDLLEGCKPAFSLRALGNVDRTKSGECVVKNIRIITWDHVIFPSHKMAYTDKLIDPREAQGHIKESAVLKENGLLIPILNEQVTSYIKEESANVKSILDTFGCLYESAMIVNNGKDVSLTLDSGEQMLVHLEQYIQDEIYNYCYRS